MGLLRTLYRPNLVNKDDINLIETKICKLKGRIFSIVRIFAKMLKVLNAYTYLCCQNLPNMKSSAAEITINGSVV